MMVEQQNKGINKMKTSYYVVEVNADGKFIAVISGLGLNKGTWDASTFSKRTAQGWAKQMRQKYSNRFFKVDSNIAKPHPQQ